MRELAQRAASSTDTETVHIQMAARLRERVQGALAQFDHREIALTLLGMQAAMQLVSQALQEMVVDRVEILDAQERGREGDREAQESEDEEVEVPIDETDHVALLQEKSENQQEDHAAMMQMSLEARAGPCASDPSWQPLHREARERLERFLRAQLEVQPHPEATLFALAQLGARPPDGCGSDSNEDDNSAEVAMGTLRPSLIRLLWTSPQHLVPGVLAELLALPGKPHEEPEQVQRTARALAQAIPATEQTEVEKVLLQGWRDESDLGIVQEALKWLWGATRRAAHREALQSFKAARRPKVPKAASPKQLTLRKAWARVTNEEAPTAEPWRSTENQETQNAREQLLGLQQNWEGLEVGTRAAMLDAILEAVPEKMLQQVANAIAETYRAMDAQTSPGSLLKLRIALRQRGGAKEQEAEDCQGELSDEQDQGEPPKLGRRLRRELATIPSQTEEKKRRQSRAQPTTKEVGAQTSPRRRQGKVPQQDESADAEGARRNP